VVACFDACADWLREHHPDRPIHYERAREKENRNTDIASWMYSRPLEVAEYIRRPQKRPFIICEYSHSMGNSNGNLRRCDLRLGRGDLPTASRSDRPFLGVHNGSHALLYRSTVHSIGRFVDLHYISWIAFNPCF
jgi:Glycosyl hydrolases family 2, TIM barrel domain